MQKQQSVAAIIFFLVIVWMVIPRDNTESLGPPDSIRTVNAVPVDQPTTDILDSLLVRTLEVPAETHMIQTRVRGVTKAFRHVQVRAETAGRLAYEPIPRGARVEAGEVLCELAVDDRGANLTEAESRSEQAEFEYAAAVDLQGRGLQSDVVVAQLKSARESASAAVVRAKIALERTKIRAPFAGIVEMRDVEIGDLLNGGAVCASVLDDSPMLLVGMIPEQNIGSLVVGANVEANLVNQKVITGKVSYLARASDAASRSYRIEIEIDKGFSGLREGITAEIMVDTETVLAHLIPSSALTLNDGGELEVKTLDPNNLVKAQGVAIIGDENTQLGNRIWVTGLTGRVNLVTVGQEIVFDGQRVNSTTGY
ncbi:efflux RND transporter periplasmic adaptor subunit [bacterium]|nr:efflux RND transporter periplasmic adaptor subunit [bacterium]